MKSSVILCMVLFVLVFRAVAAVSAACPESRSQVIVTTPSGHQKVICVSDNAAKGIGIAAQHSAVITIQVVDMSGFWNFFITKEGSLYEEAPQHLTLSQEGSSLKLTTTCNEDFPVGTGSVHGTDFSAFFDFGGGSGISLTGSVSGDSMSGSFTTPDSGGMMRAERTSTLDCGPQCNPVAVPRFVTTDYVDLSLIAQISKLRSGFGHDYSDFCESCRSMKHYYYFYDEYRIGNGIIEIHSPVDGTIVEVADEQHGASSGLINREMYIRSSLHPEIFFILSHVDLLSTEIAVGKEVTAGELVGYARIYYPELGELARGTEIGVLVHTPYGARYVSYFETMADSLFETYVARGISLRSDVQVSREVRDADALTCIGEEFVSGGTLENWVYLTPP